MDEKPVVIEYALEVWFKTTCPRDECKATNWFCDGDPTDLTVSSLEALECHACGHRWIAPEVAEAVAISSDEPEITIGVPHP